MPVILNLKKLITSDSIVLVNQEYLPQSILSYDQRIKFGVNSELP